MGRPYQMRCPQCTLIHHHYKADPWSHKLFNPACLHCGARYIQWIQRMSGRPAEARKRECRRVLERWLAHFHDEAELRALAKQSKWAVEPAPGKAAR